MCQLHSQLITQYILFICFVILVSAVQVRIRDIDVTKMDLKTFQNAIRTPDSIAPIEYAEVKVFLYYHEKTSAIKACQAMNGRFFAGKTIKATLVEQR